MGDPPLTVRPLEDPDGEAAVEVINAAAAWYAEFLPPAELHGPEMSLSEWRQEAVRMTWYGAFDGAKLLGVMGLEYVDDVALFRHAYVLPGHQRRGLATVLHDHLEAEVVGVDRIVVGTYAANHKARSALEKAGYRLSEDCESVLRRYYDIPEDRLQSSVTYEKRVDGRS
jgi:RimJ/RimL family protein N-acetyltransferase